MKFTGVIILWIIICALSLIRAIFDFSIDVAVISLLSLFSLWNLIYLDRIQKKLDAVQEIEEK